MSRSNKRYSVLIGVFISICAGIVSANVQAMSCNDFSPNSESGKDVYTPIPKSVISDSDVDRLFGVFKQAEGVWQGRGSTTVCEMRNKKLETQVNEQTVKLNMKRASDTEYRVTFETFDTDTKLRKHYKFLIHRKDKFIDVKGEGNIDITRLGSTEVEFGTQSISASIMGGGTQSQTRRLSFESMRNLRISNGGLTFEKAEYFNGVMSSFSQWTFKQ